MIPSLVPAVFVSLGKRNNDQGLKAAYIKARLKCLLVSFKNVHRGGVHQLHRQTVPETKAMVAAGRLPLCFC